MLHKQSHCPEKDMKQETGRAEKFYSNTESISKSNNKNKSMVESRLSNTVEYFLSGPTYDSNKERNAETTHLLQKDFEDVSNGSRCFDDTFSLQLKPYSKPYLHNMWHTHFKTL